MRNVFLTTDSCRCIVRVMTGVLQDVDTNTGKLSLARPGGYPSVGNHLSSLDHNGASAAPTVADAGGTEARASFWQSLSETHTQ